MQFMGHTGALLDFLRHGDGIVVDDVGWALENCDNLGSAVWCAPRTLSLIYEIHMTYHINSTTFVLDGHGK